MTPTIPTYDYTPAGRLQARTWARGVTTTYAYDPAGSLLTISYTDLTPGITYTYDRLGRQSSILMNGTTTTLAYDLAGDLLSESYSGGTLTGLSVTNGYDTLMRRTTLAALNSGSPLVQDAYGYDSASRLAYAQDGANGALYYYLANSPLVGQISFTNSGLVRMTTTKQYDFLNRLTQISSAPSAASPVGFSYAYNAANQRIQRVNSDSSYWRYGYDALGQVTSGRKYWSDQTLVAGEQFGYAFDDIGNRTQTLSGGDASGANFRLANYNANTLNQYTSRDIPGYVDVFGLAYATNPVTVNGTTAYRKGEYFRQEVSVHNTTTSVWQSVTAHASGQTDVTGNKYVPKTQEQFSYDYDGNLTNDGRFAYSWDAENRLVAMAANTSIGPQQSFKFEYDAKGRRVRKQVWGNTTWYGTATNDLKFVYDGWNPVAELNAANSRARTYLWGLDLSGSLQGAGGIGGLLELVYYGASTTNSFVAFDGNGNVASLVNAADGTSLAQYEYGPFGEVIRATGPMAKANPFRFSTKYQDDETDLLYYGFRYYNATIGRWASRDPLPEALTQRLAKHKRRQVPRPDLLVDLYAFCRNDAADRSDLLGLAATDSIPECPQESGMELTGRVMGFDFQILCFYKKCAVMSGAVWYSVDRIDYPSYTTPERWDPAMDACIYDVCKPHDNIYWEYRACGDVCKYKRVQYALQWSGSTAVLGGLLDSTISYGGSVSRRYLFTESNKGCITYMNDKGPEECGKKQQ